jgi:uncharacterized protein (TIRG00374 family)
MGAASRGGIWRLALKLVVSAGFMVFLLRRTPPAELARLLRGLDLSLFSTAVGVFFLSNVLGALQWHVLLAASGIMLSFPRTFRFYFVGLFFNNFLPANIGGDTVKVWDVARVGSSVYQVIAVTMLDRLLGIFSLCLLAVAAALYLAPRQPELPYVWYVVIFLACMVPGVGFYFFKPLGRWLRRVVLRIRPLSLDARITAIIDHLSPFKGRKALVIRLVWLSVLIQALRVVTHILVGMALGMRVDAMLVCQFFVFVPLLSLAMIPPVTINGLGIREGLGIVLFAGAGLAEADAFTMEFLTYVISVAVSLLGFLYFVGRRQAPRPGESVSSFIP